MRQVCINLYHRKPLLLQKSAALLTSHVSQSTEIGTSSIEGAQQKASKTNVPNRGTTIPESKESIHTKFHNRDLIQSTLHSLETQERLTQNRQDRQFNETEEASFIASSILGQRIFKYIEQVSHLDDVRKAQEKVLQIKERLRDSSEAKRNIWQRLHHVRQEQQRVNKDLRHSDSRASEVYLQLVKEEIDLFREEEKIQNEFKIADDEERELFVAFSVAINDSYEKEKIHTNFIKVWGLIGTLVASIITLTGAIISHYHQQAKFVTLANDLRQGVNAAIDENVSSKIGTLQQTLVDGFAKMNIKVEPNDSRGSNKESWGSFIKRYTRWT